MNKGWVKTHWGGWDIPPGVKIGGYGFTKLGTQIGKEGVYKGGNKEGGV